MFIIDFGMLLIEEQYVGNSIGVYRSTRSFFTEMTGKGYGKGRIGNYPVVPYIKKAAS